MNTRAEEIFAEAREKDGAALEAFLDAACGGDTQLRGRVESMLQDARLADSFFGEVPDISQHNTGYYEMEGDEVGPYTLREKLGEGGFGEVWMAEQSRPISRMVALKVIKAGMNTREFLARFESERQALAMMDHPNIAKVLDAGATAAGRPYFAMELVHGIAITRYCDEAQMGIDARLKLFADVCSAVGHAHQKGIIHRDIKPSNILVTQHGDRPVIKVIDFGIAKAVEGKLTDLTLFTRFEQFLGTPAYMSPEQASMSGLDIDTRADIYGLGVLLYELLVGKPPFDSEKLLSAGHEAMRRIIREEEPLRPSTRLGGITGADRMRIALARKTIPDKLHLLVDRDLDWIVLKAIDKDRERRYSSADDLAKDLASFLQNQPVSATPPSAGYLFGKFARRHRTAFLVVGCIIALLLTTTAISSWMAVRALRAEQIASERLREATIARDDRAAALQKAYAAEELATRRLREVTLERDAKDEALEDAKAVSNLMIDIFGRPRYTPDGRLMTLGHALDDARSKLDSGLAEHPNRLAGMKEALAATYASLRLYLQAIELYKESYATRNSLPNDDYTSIANTLFALAECYEKAGQYQNAVDTVELLLEKSQVVMGENSTEAIQAGVKLQVYEKLALSAGSEQISDDLITDPNTASINLDDIKSHEIKSAKLQSVDQAISILSATHSPTDFLMVNLLRTQASMYYSAGFRTEAARIQENLVGVVLQKHGVDRPETLRDEDRLAYYEYRAGNFEEAHVLNRQLLVKFDKVLGGDHPDTLRFKSRYALQWMTHAETSEELVLLTEPLVSKLRDRFGNDNRTTLNAISVLGRSYARVGRVQDALSLLNECGPKMPDDTFLNGFLAILQLWTGDVIGYEATRAWMLEYGVLKAPTYRGRPDILRRVLELSTLAPIKDQQQIKAVEEILKRAMEIKASTGDEVSGVQGWNAYHMAEGMTYYRIGRFAEAKIAIQQTLAPIVGNAKPPHWHIESTARLFLAMTLHALDDEEAARQQFLAAEKLIQPPPSSENPYVNSTWDSEYPATPWIIYQEAKTHLRKKR